MKGFLISLSLLLSVSISARELTFSERSMLINYKKINHVKSHMLSKIIVDDLSLGEFLSYKVLQNSCKPLDDILNKISLEDVDFADQSERITTLVSVCSQGVIGLTELRLRYQSK